MKSFLSLFILAFFTLHSFAQSTHWRIEAESPLTRVLLRGDTLDITSPKGLSLWWNKPLTAPCIISYRACVVMENGPYDRLSDLNCFWMVSSPLPRSAQSDASHLKKREVAGEGVFSPPSPWRGVGGEASPLSLRRGVGGEAQPPYRIPLPLGYSCQYQFHDVNCFK